MSYLAKVGEALAECRRRGTPFDLAWTRTMRDVPRRSLDPNDGITPSTLNFAKRAFCEGYYRRDVLGPASILAESDGWVGDHRVDGHATANAVVVA